MVKIVRAAVTDVSHHVTQRGNRRQRVFFTDEDYATYLDLLAVWCEKEGVEIWAYCLMPNHVHLVTVPRRQESLRRAIGEAHRRYTLAINAREGTGRPARSKKFIERVSGKLGRDLDPKRPGRKRKSE